MVSRLFRSYRSRRMAGVIREQAAFYSGFEAAGSTYAADEDRVRSWQLHRFNELWRDIPFRVPYWADRMGGLPTQFSSWEEFVDVVPVTDRRTVQKHGDDLADPTAPPDYFRTTGGSTAEPVQLPAWHRENDAGNADMWFARGWYGIEPGSRLFVLWGHRHLLGHGLAGKANAALRHAKDFLAGYRRFSAYDLSDDAMARAGDELLDFRPDYVLGYASALDRLARVNRGRDFSGLKLKAAIATAESFPRPDSKEVIGEVLACPVPMEYGSVETGPLAYQHADGTFHAFWRHYVLEGVPSRDVPGSLELLVTSLFPRCVPLIRYRLGDLIDPLPAVPSIRVGFQAVRGRADDLVDLGDSKIHYETFEHVLSRKPWVKGYQIVQGDVVRLRYTAPAALDESQKEELRRDLARLSPALRRLELERVDALDRTIAGKLCHVVRDEACETSRNADLEPQAA